jgi:hypothetical protein
MRDLKTIRAAAEMAAKCSGIGRNMWGEWEDNPAIVAFDKVCPPNAVIELLDRIAELEAALEPSRVALTLAARTFDTYAMVHRAKGTNDSAEKAEANRVMALRMYEALEQFPSKIAGDAS